MTSSEPGLLTIPREIRDQIWELQYIKNRNQDPVAQFQSWHSYPYMRSAIYLTNRQLNEEHKDNLSRTDKRVNKFISGSRLLGLIDKRHLIEKDLTYPSLRIYTLMIFIVLDATIAEILKRMIFLVHHMRKQNVHRHNILRLDVMTNGIHGRIFLGHSLKPRKKSQKLKYYGQFYLKVDVFELKVLEYKDKLIAPPPFDTDASPALEIDKRAQLALDILRDTTENEGKDSVAGLVSLLRAGSPLLK